MSISIHRWTTESLLRVHSMAPSSNAILNGAVENLDSHIESYAFSQSEKLRLTTLKRRKKTEYQIGTVCLWDIFLTAFSKFDENNKAVLTMPEYLAFLINFWDKVNNVYAQQSVSVTIFGSGIRASPVTKTLVTKTC